MKESYLVGLLYDINWKRILGRYNKQNNNIKFHISYMQNYKRIIPNFILVIGKIIAIRVIPIFIIVISEIFLTFYFIIISKILIYAIILYCKLY